MITHNGLEKGLPPGVNWNANVSLLLDGVSVDNLMTQLYQWLDNPEFEPLYLGTRWNALNDISPCLIRMPSRSNHALDQFLQNLSQEWGYLLVSNRPWTEQMNHLRWLLNVRHPQGEHLLPRLADPCLAHALFGHSESLSDRTLFGPFSQVLTADVGLDCWYLHQRPGPVPAPQYDAPYQLSDEQLALLDQASFHRVVSGVKQHLCKSFSTYRQMAPLTSWEHAYQLTTQAYERGFCKEQAILLFANIHGWLGDNALLENPDLDAQLTALAQRDTTLELRQVAEQAKHRAEQRLGIEQ